MPRPSFRAALTGASAMKVGVALAMSLAALVGSIPASSAYAAPLAEETDPLIVHLDKITPVAREGGRVRIAGTVTNASPDTWTRINLHPFSSQSPILDAPLLAASAETDPAAYVGGRVTAPGAFDTVDILQPGQSDSFSISVPVSLLGIDSAAGVYWIGVHALGDGAEPRDAFADGKARTFIPFLPRTKERVPVSIVLPLRGAVWYEPDGRLSGTERWTDYLSDGGRYDVALDAAVAAGDTPFTWLVDPAVLTAISRLTIGNPPRSLGPDPDVPGQDGTTPEGEVDEESSAPPLATLAPTSGDEQSEAEKALSALAREWMAQFLQVAVGRDVLALPFGDLDVSAAMREQGSRYEQATTRSQEVMESLGIAYRPAIAPQNAFLSPEALSAAPPETTILLGDTAFAVPPRTSTSLVRLLGHRVVVTSSGAAAGGPGPTPALDPLALRQRLLSEAALHLVDSSVQPLVMTLPTSWKSGEAEVVFEALKQSWVEPVRVPELSASPAVGVSAGNLVYTEEDRAAELGAANFAAADDLTAAATLMEQVLTLQTTVERQVLDEALATLSSQHASRPAVAARSAARLEENLRDQLASIRINPDPKSVTLASDSGPLGLTLVNGLDQPVTVILDAETDDDIELTGIAPRELAPSSRTLARLEARTDRPGIHTVRLFVTSEGGESIGSSRELPIRAAQVSGFIWLAMAVGAGLLFSAIALRLWRQVRRRARGESEPTGEPAPDAV